MVPTNGRGLPMIAWVHLAKTKKSSTLPFSIETMDLKRCIDALQAFKLDSSVNEILQSLLTAAQRDPDPRVHFESFYLPFLRDLMALVRKDPPTFSTYEYKPLYKCLISSYLTFSAGLEPKKPLHWSPAPPFRPCTTICQHCTHLSIFLNDPLRPVWEFRDNQAARDKLTVHLNRQLTNQSILRVETLKNKTPYTLVIRKVNGEYPATHLVWEERCAEAAKWFKTLENAGPLKKLLEEKYNDMLDHTTGTSKYGLKFLGPDSRPQPAASALPKETGLPGAGMSANGNGVPLKHVPGNNQTRRSGPSTTDPPFPLRKPMDFKLPQTSTLAKRKFVESQPSHIVDLT